MSGDFTPVQRRIVTLIGAKKLFQQQWKELDEPPSPEDNWMMEALELLLMLEIERLAIADGVDDIEPLIEAVQDCGVEVMEEAAVDKPLSS